jgi:hypothetical protein
VNYRNITPTETMLAIEAHSDSEESRKRILSETIATVTRSALPPRACSLPLRPGQP